MERIDNYKEFIREFIKICGRVSLYGMAHPASDLAAGSFLSSLGELLRSESELTVASDDGKVLVNGEMVEERGALQDTFLRLGLHSITFTRGVDKAGITGFMRSFASGNNPSGIEDFLKDGGARGIMVNTVHYVKAVERADVEDAGVDEPLEALETIEGLSLERLISKVIDRAVRKEEDRARVFELVMGKFKGELEERVKEATHAIETEKDRILREKENTENMIAEAVLGSITVDEDGNVLFCDSDGGRIMGGGLKGKAGKPVWEGLLEGQMVTVARGAGALTVSDVMVTGEDETKRILRASNAIIRDAGGRMVGLFSVLSDLTKYRELDQMKKDFVANVTHELRTPLVAARQALSNLITLTGDGLDADQRKMIDIALRNTDRLSRLVNDILDFSKLEAGRLKLRQEIIETGVLLKEIAATLKPLSDAKGVTLTLDAPHALPRLFADRDRVTQVFVNLLSNAIKFTGSGGSVTLAIAGASTSGTNAFLEIAVRDTGRGIEKDDIGKIFEKFVQVGAGNNSLMRGTGLGLTITKAIVELHGGTVCVESEPGRGSVFTVSLPMLPEDTVFLKEMSRARNQGIKAEKGVVNH